MYSQSVTFTATVSGFGGGQSSGSIVFTIDGLPVATQTIVANQATFTTSLLAVGSHTVHADYAGDSNLTGSSADLAPNQAVNARSTSTSVSCTPNPVDAGASTSCTVTVTDTESLGTKTAPLGDVTLDNAGANGSFTGTCLLAAATADSATCSMTYTPSASAVAGTHNISATYASTDNVHSNSNNTTTPFALGVTLNADLEVTITPAPTPAIVGETVDYAIKVKNTGPSDSGAFTLTDALPVEVWFQTTSPGCAETPIGSGTVVCTSSGLSAGASIQWTITAVADLAGSPLNTASISSATTPDANGTNNTGSAMVDIGSGELLSDVAAGDSDWQNRIDGVDALFTKSGSGSSTSYTLKLTNPGTFRYRLSLESQMGIHIHLRGKPLPDITHRGMVIKDFQRRLDHGLPAMVPTTMSSSTGTPVPSNAAALGMFTQPAFMLSGRNAVKAGPGLQVRRPACPGHVHRRGCGR